MTYREFYFAVKGNNICSRLTGKVINRTEFYFRSSVNEMQAIIHNNSVNFYLEPRPESKEIGFTHPAILPWI